MIFGISHSLFTYGTESVELTSSNMTTDYSIPDEIEHVSIVNGLRSYIDLKDKSEFTVTMLQDVTSGIFTTIKSYQGKTVNFYPHSGSDAIKNTAGNNADFILYSVEPYYLYTPDNYDIIKLNFKSLDRTSLDDFTDILGYGYQYGQYYGFGF